MQYKSPIPPLQHAGIDIRDISMATLNKAQKALLTELDIAENKSLLIKGDELTKDDIISIFDELKHKQTLRFHQWIYNSPYLLTLIQHGEAELNKDTVLFDPSLRYHGDFDHFKTFLSPYLSQPLAKAIDRAFQMKQFRKAQDLMTNHYLISSPYFDETFARVRRSMKALVEEISSAQHAFKRSNFSYINRSFIDFLNALPEQLSGDRRSIVNSLINLSVDIQDKHPLFCYDLYQVLWDVKCDEEMKKIIFHNHDVFVSKKKEHESSTSPRHYLVMGIFLLMIFLRACT